ncbi:PLP-dependent aminotransferase family protein [Deinococcus sonorensis]|uniref:PLP-dependent aminotransferase family protein n=2 Tax=Deinococcus sonorensis TaxID=309891 RepID=A0AAU7U641_9DEIO
MANTGSVGRLVKALLQHIEQDGQPGEQLPTTRSLVERYAASPVTVQKALRELTTRGVIETRPGQGTFIAALPTPPRAARFEWQTLVLGERPDTLDAFGTLFAPPRPDVLPLGSGYLDATLQPLTALAGAMSRAARRPGAWDRLPAEGHEGLRTWFAAQLGPGFHTRDVLIVPGGQAALSTALRALTRSGQAVVVESPTHLGALAALRAAGLRAVPVPTDAGGLDPDRLHAALETSGARVVLYQPLHANPTGTTLARERHAAVLQVLARHQAYLVEDDAARDLTLEGAPTPPLALHDDAGHVLYIRSLTKSVAPGLRVAALVARGPVSARLRALRTADELFVPGPMQETALEWVSSPAREAHQTRLRTHLRSRRDALLAALATHLPAARVTRVPRGGLFAWLELPEGSDDVQLARAALDAGVQVNPGAAWFPAEAPGPFVRLSYAAANETTLQAGVQRLAEVWTLGQ